jgi:hypothetical protein
MTGSVNIQARAVVVTPNICPISRLADLANLTIAPRSPSRAVT